MKTYQTSSTQLCKILLLIQVVYGCSSIQQKKEKLDVSLSFFHNHVKDGNYDKAILYVAPECLDTFYSLHHPTKNVLVMEEFSVTSISFSKDGKRAEVMVNAQVRRRDSLTVKEIVYKETWEDKPQGFRLVYEEVILNQ